MNRTDGPSDALRERIATLLGARVVNARPTFGGYTPAERWIVELSNGLTAFAKTGGDADTSLIASWLRVEYRAYSEIRGPFMPRVLGWEDADDRPLLLLEDLSRAHWPPPWSAERIKAVEQMLGSVASTPVPRWAEDLELRERSHLTGWARVQAEPSAFLRLGICTEGWLTRHIDTLLDVGASAALGGDALVHFDVRSDNLCLLQPAGGLLAKLIDWNHLARGDAMVDRMLWLSSLQREGGPPPWDLIPDSKGFSALLSGYFAAQGSLPAIPTAPGVRTLQREQLAVTLPWAIRELNLEPLDGPLASQ